ncbi:hypothetical protein KAU33_06740 [Candidatus Dependentiae bacterium]|nr:hypothetical protein [Candidatus Dependentiae bacterium]
MIQLIIFEDIKFKNFYSLAYFRPVFEMKLGTSTLEEKIRKLYPDTLVAYSIRAHLKEYYSEIYPDKMINSYSKDAEMFLCINGRLLLDSNQKIPLEGDEEIVFNGDDVVYLRIKRDKIDLLDNDEDKHLKDVMLGVFKNQREEKGYSLLSYPWEMIPINGAWIKKEFDEFKNRSGVLEKSKYNFKITGDIENLWISSTAKLENFVELNVEGGPIIVEAGVEIHSFSRIEGPAYIGKNCRLLGAKVRSGTSLFENCRIGGEVEESIFFGNSNHYHHGFIGHSVVGEWVNIGALTATSDLKNNYGKIRIITSEKTIQTDQIKIGSIIGDFTKFGIGTLLNTGSLIGVSANVFGGGIQPKFIPSFSWGGGENFKEYNPGKGVETNRTILSRRNKIFSKTFEQLYLNAFSITSSERKNLL